MLLDRFALIADVHGNIWALDAVLADIERRGIRTIYDLGDSLCSPLEPVETADRFIGLGIPSLLGNEDRILIERNASTPNTRFTLQRLEPRHIDWLAVQPMTRQITDDILLCHGTPDSDTQYLVEEVTRTGAQLRSIPGLRLLLLGRSESLIACGHSHVPRLIWRDTGRMVVNPGSVGLQAFTDLAPWPHGMESGSPHARYAIVTATKNGWVVDHIAVPYDHVTASACAADNGRGDWAARLLTGRI